MGNVASWLEHYSYGILFAALLLEMLALPLPGEMLMSYTGVFISSGSMNLVVSIVCAGVGVTFGVTLSYWIGYKLGKPFLLKYGKHIHLGEAQLEKLSTWFEKYGEKLLFIAYFIPGVRHVTGYFCGVMRIPFRHYAIYAYSGAWFWVCVFILLGNALGTKFEAYHHTINRYMIIMMAVGIASSLLFYLFQRLRKKAV
ncbi:alkaline phosphatase [Paenibacillus sp. CCS19]|uniref:DedA family protein n=1 Tax=Paenibacillus sp. CCS19 TaxID=3158387 RepID=UPI0025660C9C|nr:DedA family protein [Paenibacillus cellulosilyticus]GMK37394.1 alkaline phosphatase [Paenibacillus cellulosilyticus]